jgi:hypothetical protein
MFIRTTEFQPNSMGGVLALSLDLFAWKTALNRHNAGEAGTKRFDFARCGYHHWNNKKWTGC